MPRIMLSCESIGGPKVNAVVNLTPPMHALILARLAYLKTLAWPHPELTEMAFSGDNVYIIHEQLRPTEDDDESLIALMCDLLKPGEHVALPDGQRVPAACMTPAVASMVIGADSVCWHVVTQTHVITTCRITRTQLAEVPFPCDRNPFCVIMKGHAQQCQNSEGVFLVRHTGAMIV